MATKIGQIPTNMSNVTNKSISVFFPAYNEEGNIKEIVESSFNYLKSRFQDFEILVVSEGSTDKTNEIVKDLAKNILNLKLLSKPVSYRYAGALRTGFTNSTKDLIFYMDGDGQFDIREMDKLLPLIDKYDIVTGYKIERNDPLMRSWMSWLYNTTIKILFNLKVKDVNCAFKLYRREVIDRVDFLPNLTEGVINVEVYVTALKNGYTIGEVPINHFARTKGQGAEIGRRGKIIAFVKPRIIKGFIKNTISVWKKFH